MKTVFQFAADILRLFAVIGLVIKIWTSKNSSGISGKTQILYALVCITRYLDLFYQDQYTFSLYNTSFKVAFILIHLLTIYLIYVKFRDTYSSNEDSFNCSYLIYAAAALAVLKNDYYSSIEIFWTFSIYLEAVAMVPQFLMIYWDKTNETRNFIFYYVFAMGTYRALYAMNWVYKYMMRYPHETISEYAGGVQLAIYWVFACLYVTRGKTFRSVVNDADDLISVHE